MLFQLAGRYVEHVNSYLSRRAAEVGGFDDAIMLDQSGRITEATAANLFLIQKTQSLHLREYFPGITRSTLLDVAQSLGIGGLNAMSAP